MEATDSLTFADLPRRHRTAAALAQKDLAARAGLSPRGILYLECGACQPCRDTVRRLADALALSEQERGSGHGGAATESGHGRVYGAASSMAAS